MLAWMKHKLESRLLGEIINNLRYADDIALKAESKEELKSLWMKVKEGSEKVGLKFKLCGKELSMFGLEYAKAFDCVDHNKLWKILKEMGIPDHLICLLRNLYAG